METMLRINEHMKRHMPLYVMGAMVLGLNGVLILVGAICALLVLLVRVLLSKKPEKTETACKPERPVRGFFSPAIIVFLIMSVGMAVLNLILGAKT